MLEAERDARVLVEEAVDVTLPTDRRPGGARHPLTTLMERIEDVFVAMGYEVAEGPEVEAEWFNFDALNIAPDHPARTMQDTFFVGSPEGGVVLRTHTSPVQVRSMLQRRSCRSTWCARGGSTGPTSSTPRTRPVFHQIEGLVVDEGITMADLKGTLDHFAAAMFGAGLVTRLRPSYFPFTEPQRRGRPAVLRLPGRLRGRPAEPLPDLLVGGLDRVGRVRHGQPAGARRLRHRRRSGTPGSPSGWASSAR